jgi:hypothetical protein
MAAAAGSGAGPGGDDRGEKLENTLRECLGLAPMPATIDPSAHS